MALSIQQPLTSWNGVMEIINPFKEILITLKRILYPIFALIPKIDMEKTETLWNKLMRIVQN